MEGWGKGEGTGTDWNKGAPSSKNRLFVELQLTSMPSAITAYVQLPDLSESVSPSIN